MLSKTRLLTNAAFIISKRQDRYFLALSKRIEKQRFLNPTKCVNSVENKSVVTSSVFRSEPASSMPGTLTNDFQAQDLVRKLTADERKFLLTALQGFESNRIKEECEGQLAAHRWRSKFGRPSKVPKLGDVDPTGSYCPVPEDWLKKKYAATVPKPTTNDLFHLAVANSIPFIGFGFLDNFIMIVAGDYIDHVLGTYIYLSTMAAAALGNTFSDVIGIGSAFYVERFAERIGFQPPTLSPVQLDMPASRRASNMGRVLGITIGCLLGMIPLLFIKDLPKPTPKNKVESQPDIETDTKLQPEIKAASK